ncbi:hypothetical protein FRB97_009083 [Tulasnella sp. 331]|nr:hypothetical protein FRB97_009083 [Tulasnella sp. 331]
MAISRSTDAFELNLQTLRTRHTLNSPGKDFIEPSRYSKDAAGVEAFMFLSVRKTPPFPPSWWQLKARFQPWIWSARAKRPETPRFEYEHCVRDKTQMLELALPGISEARLGPYPSRPFTLLPLSPSMDQIRGVLDRAPCVLEVDQYENKPAGMDRDGG